VLALPNVRLGWPQRGERWPLAVLAGLTALLFRRALFGGQVLCERDIGIWWYGRIQAFVSSVAAGSWPLWDPHTAFGQPLLANPGAQVLYPPTWISLLVSPGTFVTIDTVGHLLFAGIGLWALARRLGLSVPGALTAAAIWTTSGPLLSLVNVWLHFHGAAWIPWVLLATDGALRAPSVARSLTLGATLAGQILAGSPDMCAMTGLLAAFYALRFFEWRSPGSPANRRRLGVGVLAVFLAAGLTAAQWLPALGLLLASARPVATAVAKTHWSLHPASLLQCLLPALPHTLPLLPWVKKALFDGQEPLIHSVYVGLAAVPLVAVSVLGHRRGLAAQLGGLGLASVLVALGRHSVFFGALVAALPPLGILRYPSKAIILLPLAWSLLAGLGFDAWRDRGLSWGQRARRIAVLPALTATVGALGALWLTRFRAESLGRLFLEPGGPGSSFTRVLAPTSARLGWAISLALAVAVLAVLRARRPQGASLLSVGAAGLAVLDLFLAHQALNPTVDRELFERPPVTLAHIDPARPVRVYSFGYGPRLKGQPYRRPPMENPFELAPGGTGDPRVELALGLQTYLYYAAATRWGLSSGYGGDLQGTAPRYLTNLTIVVWASQETPQFLRLLRLGSVSYLLALHTEGLEDLTLRAVLPGPFARPIRLFGVPDPLPRTYAVGRAFIADGLTALKALVDPAFDPTREILLPAGPVLTARSGFSGTSELRAYLPDRVEIEAAFDQPGYAVLVDAWDPGWRASVDGADAPVLRANVAFRAVAVPAGRHRIELVYRPRSVGLGLLVSATALAALVLLAVRAARAAAAARAAPPGGAGT
jgi:hypothetical protein